MAVRGGGSPGGRRAHGALETEVLGAVATAEQPVTVGEELAGLGGSLAYNTVYTILVRLVEKGLVERAGSARGLTYRSTPQAAELAAAQMQRLLHRGPSPGRCCSRSSVR